MNQIFCYKAAAGDPPVNPVYGCVLGGLDNWGLKEDVEGYLFQNVILQACTLQNLYMDIGVAPGTGNTRTMTVRNGDVDTAVSLVFADDVHILQDNDHAPAFAVDDLVSLRMDKTGSPAGINRIATSFEIVTPNTKICQYFSGNVLAADGTTGTFYRGAFDPSGEFSFTGDPDTGVNIMPIPGTMLGYAWIVKNVSTVTLSAFDMDVLKNGVPVPGTKTTTILGFSETFLLKKTDFAIPYVVGDLLSLRIVDRPDLAGGAKFFLIGGITTLAESAQDGESMWIDRATDSSSTPLDNYGTCLFSDGTADSLWQGPEERTSAIALPGKKFALDKLIAKCMTPLGDGVVRQIILRKNSSNTALGITLLGESTDYVQNLVDLAYYTLGETLNFISFANANPVLVQMPISMRQTVAGIITVRKVTTPGGSPQSFDFETDLLYGNFSLSDGESVEILTAPGVYSIEEIVPDGWVLAGVSVSTGDPNTAIVVEANDLIEVIFTNALADSTGTLIVQKVTTPPGSLQPFSVFVSPDLEPASFELIDGGARTFTDVPAGTYSVSESLPEGWAQVGIVVSNGDPADAITITSGTVTATITNALIPPAPPVNIATRLLKLRRLRRSPHLVDELVRMVYHSLQFDMQVGVGLIDGDGSDQVMMLRWSDDGGRTWGNEVWITAGEIGAYGTRAIFRQLGQGDARVFELVVDKPVAWRFVNVYLRLTKGTS